MAPWELNIDTSPYNERLLTEDNPQPPRDDSEPLNPREQAWAEASENPRGTFGLEQPNTDNQITLESILVTFLTQQGRVQERHEQLLKKLTQVANTKPAPDQTDHLRLIHKLQAIDPLRNDRRKATRQQINAQFSPKAKAMLNELQKVIGARTRAATLEYAVEVALVAFKHLNQEP